MNVTRFKNNNLTVERIIYSASQFAKENLIYLQEIGNSIYYEPYTSTRTHLDSYLFVLVNKGHGTLMFHDTEYHLSANTCIFINCREPYILSSKCNSWDISWVHFDGVSMNGIYEKFINRSGSPCFSVNDSGLYSSLHSSIMNVITNDDYVRDMHLMSALSNLLSIIMKDCWSESPSHSRQPEGNKWFPIKEYLDNHYIERISLDILSEIFHIDKFYLTRKFKELYGITINAYIQKKRINSAKQYLRFSNMSVTEIAEMCGYSDCAYFTRIFKTNEGITPSKFRREWKTKYICNY